jgi:hypothetical protein
VTIQLQVVCDFSGTAYGGTPTWTDVSSYVLAGQGYEPISITWGRQDEASAVSPSQGTVTLNNSDGRFTPGRTASPYYPNVKRRVRRQIRATVNSTTVYLLDDLTDSWEVTPSSSGPWTTVQSGTDVFGRYGAETLRSMFDETALVDAPAALYLADSGGLQDLTGQQQALVAYQTPDGEKTASGSITYDSGDGGVVLGGAGAVGYYLSTSIQRVRDMQGNYEVWFSTTTMQAQTLLSLNGTALVWLDSSGRVNSLNSSGGTFTSSKSYADGVLHQVVFTYHPHAAEGSTLWVDNVYISGDSSHTIIFIGTVPMTLQVGSTDGKSACFNGTIRRVVIDGPDPALSDDTYIAATTMFAGETTDAHISRLLSYRTNFGSSLDTGQSNVGMQDTTGVTLQQALLDVATVEGGIVYVNGQGQLVFRNRNNNYDPAPVLTLDANVSGVDIATTFRDDDQYVVNDVTVSWPGGSGQRQYNSASILADGSSPDSISAPFNSAWDANQAAGWTIARGVPDQVWVPTLTVNLLAVSAATAQKVLQLRPLDTVTLTNLPSTAPATTMTVQVQGGSLSLGVDAMTATIFCTAAPPTVLRIDASNDSYDQLDQGSVFAW